MSKSVKADHRPDSDAKAPAAVLLIVDDDPDNLESYAMGFARSPYQIITAAGGRQALEKLRSECVDVVLTDLKMPEVDGLEVVRAASKLPDPPVVLVVTAYGTIETAVEAMRLGALDYLTKPVNLLELRAKIEKAVEYRGLRVRNQELQGLLNERFKFEGVVGVSPQMRDLIEQSRMVARTRASVLIEGESGTGKELVARAIHFNSPRASGPFVPIHCAALPETLLESELFGHEKGAFTGAEHRRSGQFESAEGGTVFLDELGEIPLATQVKLLRVLEQREIVRVGATQPLPIDIRLVAATNKRLAREVEEGRFREDLYYRLNVVRILIPPLRERPQDIPPLVEHFLEQLSKENDRPRMRLTTAALERLVAAPWYGNIRELRNVIERIIIFADSSTIDVSSLPAEIAGLTPQPVPGGRAAAGDSGVRLSSKAADEGRYAQTMHETPSTSTLAELERQHILTTLEHLNGNRTQAAEALGISRRTLQRKLQHLGLAGE